jgi:hypothetical protein
MSAAAANIAAGAAAYIGPARMRTSPGLARSLLPPMLHRPIAGIACDQGGGAVSEASWAKIGPSSHPVPERTRRIAGLSGFFTLIQSREGPDR